MNCALPEGLSMLLLRIVVIIAKMCPEILPKMSWKQCPCPPPKIDGFMKQAISNAYRPISTDLCGRGKHVWKCPPKLVVSLETDGFMKLSTLGAFHKFPLNVLWLSCLYTTSPEFHLSYMKQRPLWWAHLNVQEHIFGRSTPLIEASIGQEWQF